MIDLFYSRSDDFDRWRCGPLGAHVDGFARWLFIQGYGHRTGQLKIRLVADFSRWLAQRHLEVKALNEEQVARFIKVRMQQRRWRPRHRQSLIQLLGYLREADIIAGPAVAVSDHPREQILREYADYLNDQRGLKQLTIDKYLPVARRFLEARVDAEGLGLEQLQLPDITGFLLAESAKEGSSRAPLTAGVLRSFLGFLTLTGKIATPLAMSVPAVASGRWSGLPQFLETAQVEQLLRSCDPNCALGRRDYAVLLLVARLGLRAGEVAHLNLEHIDGEAGELYIRGKSAREDRLPLLPDVGRAIADYLQRDRPQSPCRRVFLRLPAPHQGFLSAGAIAHIVRRALARAQLHPLHQGAHLLRRSLATQMLRQGASLTQIGQILRHQRVQTTEIYAKVDEVALRALAQPWPGGAQGKRSAPIWKSIWNCGINWGSNCI